MTNHIEAMKMALEALEHHTAIKHPQQIHYRDAAITALREALAQPDVGMEPVAWEGGEGWESLAWALCADENGEDACNDLIWEGGPTPEPWGDRWMKYEGDAKRMIALVQAHTHPPAARVPMTDEEIDAVPWGPHEGNPITFAEGLRDFARAIEAAHGIGGKS